MADIFKYIKMEFGHGARHRQFLAYLSVIFSQTDRRTSAHTPRRAFERMTTDEIILYGLHLADFSEINARLD